MKILIIGGGNMGLTYAEGFLRSHITSKEGMMILEKSPKKAIELAKKEIGTIYGEPGPFMKTADIIILAVKPQDTSKLFAALKEYVDPQQVFVSIMAGIKIDQIRLGLGIEKVIRAMPNLPAKLGIGMTVFTSTEEVTRIELVMVQNLINTTGKSIYVNDESMIDSATAISGSGPAYVYYFMDSMIKSAEKLGFTTPQAEMLVNQTFRGAVELVIKSGLTCEEWMDRVASKGGTTEAALKSFNNNKVFNDIDNGCTAAYDRAVELGEH